jgi:competence protein ComEA
MEDFEQLGRPVPSERDRLVEGLSRRFEFWRGDRRVIAFVVGAVALGAGAYWYRDAARGAPVPPGAPASSVSSTGTDLSIGVATTSASGSDGDSGSEGPVIVHVAGAVRRPGVVSLPAGSRVVDAIDAAGGSASDADLDRLNLASVLADGQRIFVARVGDPPTAGVIAGTATPGVDPSNGGGLIDLNLATVADLETLPGIGPTLAAAIIAERDRRGGFTSVDDLRSVRGIGESRFAQIRDLVTV